MVRIALLLLALSGAASAEDARVEPRFAWPASWKPRLGVEIVTRTQGGAAVRMRGRCNLARRPAGAARWRVAFTDWEWDSVATGNPAPLDTEPHWKDITETFKADAYGPAALRAQEHSIPPFFIAADGRFLDIDFDERAELAVLDALPAGKELARQSAAERKQFTELARAAMRSEAERFWSGLVGEWAGRSLGPVMRTQGRCGELPCVTETHVSAASCGPGHEACVRIDETKRPDPEALRGAVLDLVDADPQRAPDVRSVERREETTLVTHPASLLPVRYEQRTMLSAQTGAERQRRLVVRIYDFPPPG